jgi:hypothetical protein
VGGVSINTKSQCCFLNRVVKRLFSFVSIDNSPAKNFSTCYSSTEASKISIPSMDVLLTKEAGSSVDVRSL